MKKATRFVSLDCSTKCSGVAVWEDNKLLFSHVIDHSAVKDVDERINLMGKDLWKDLDEYSPTAIYIEDTYCHGNPDIQKKLNRVQGIVLAWCIQHDANFNYIMPSAWRKYIPYFPNGRAKRDEQKRFSVNYVTMNYGFSPITDDESDAILIGEAVIRASKKDT